MGCRSERRLRRGGSFEAILFMAGTVESRTSVESRTATFHGESRTSTFPNPGHPLFRLDFNIFATTFKAHGNFVRMTSCQSPEINKSPSLKRRSIT